MGGTRHSSPERGMNGGRREGAGEGRRGEGCVRVEDELEREMKQEKEVGHERCRFTRRSVS